MNLKAVMVAGVLALLLIPLTGGAGIGGSEAQLSIEKPDAMGVIRDTAKQYKEEAEFKATAHYHSARYHRRMHAFGNTVAIFATGLVTLATTLSKTQSSESIIASRFFWIVPLLAFFATGINSLQASLNNGGDAAKHQASMVAYENVKRRFELFLISVRLDIIKPEEGLQQLNILRDQFNTVAENSLILTDEAYVEALRSKQIRDRPKATP